MYLCAAAEYIIAQIENHNRFFIGKFVSSQYSGVDTPDLTGFRKPVRSLPRNIEKIGKFHGLLLSANCLNNRS